MDDNQVHFGIAVLVAVTVLGSLLMLTECTKKSTQLRADCIRTAGNSERCDGIKP